LDFAKQHKIEPVEVGPLAKINEHPGFAPNQPTQYMRPIVPPDKVNYPTRDFADKLVDLRDKPLGETILLHDAPRNIFYVGVLTERNEPSEFSFQLAYARSAGEGQSGIGGDPLLRQFEDERRGKLYVATMEQLRADARLVPVEEELKKFSSRESGSGSGGGGEED